MSRSSFAVQVDPTPTPAPVSDERGQVAPNEEDAARWAAFYEGLPADLREGLDELGHEIGRGLRPR